MVLSQSEQVRSPTRTIYEAVTLELRWVVMIKGRPKGRPSLMDARRHATCSLVPVAKGSDFTYLGRFGGGL